RRRHTRFSRDWSSDVCSSDLDPPAILARPEHRRELPDAFPAVRMTMADGRNLGQGGVFFDLDGTLVDTAPDMVAVLVAMQQSKEIGRASCRERGVEAGGAGGV